MYNRLDDIPIYELKKGAVSALFYNHVHHALNSLAEEIRLNIPKLQHIELILQRNAWIIIDSQLNDMPIAAWIDFQTHHRDNLHESVDCQLNLYHMHAHLILDRVLEAMELLLGEKLDEHLSESPTVIPFHKNDD